MWEVSTSTHHQLEPPKSWGAGDPQDAQYCLGSDFCLLHMITHRNSQRAIHCFHGRSPKTCSGLLFTFPANIRHGGSVGLNEIHVFQELNDRALYLVWSAELFKFLPTSYSFHTYLDRRGIREGFLYCFCPRLTSSLALGHWSLRIGLVVSDLFSYHKR